MATKKYENDDKLAHALADALTALPDNWIMCRDMRHAWEVNEDFHVSKSKGSKAVEIRRVLDCLRCETKRIEVYHQTKWGLEKVRQNYDYPEHYQIHGVPRGVKPSYIVQGEVYRRSMSKVATVAKKAKSA